MTRGSLEPQFEGQFEGRWRQFCILMGVVGVIALLWNQPSDGDGSRVRIHSQPRESAVETAPLFPSDASGLEARAAALQRRSDAREYFRRQAVESAIARRTAQDSEAREDVLRELRRLDQIERADAEFLEIVNASLYVVGGLDVLLEALEAWGEEGGLCHGVLCHHVGVVETLATVMASVEAVQVYVDVLESVDAVEVEPSVEPGS